MVDGRALTIKGFCLGQMPDEFVEIAGLEFMRILGQQHQIADAIIARPCPEKFARVQRGNCCKTSCSPSANDNAVAIHKPAINEALRRRYAILNVDDAPLAIKSLAVGAAITCRTFIIYVNDAKTPARPPLDAQ